jgi:hypothetical protein
MLEPARWHRFGALLVRFRMSSRHHARGAAWRQERAGGASRDRTGDLLVANQALSQLSYGPVSSDWPKTAGSDFGGHQTLILVGLGGVAPPTSPLSGVRSN